MSRFTVTSSWCYLSYANKCKILRSEDHYKSLWSFSVHFKSVAFLDRRKMEEVKEKAGDLLKPKCLQICLPEQTTHTHFTPSPEVATLNQLSAQFKGLFFKDQPSLKHAFVLGKAEVNIKTIFLQECFHMFSSILS